MVPGADGTVVIAGQLDGAVQYIEGYVNQGRFGVEPCTLDPSVARPRFRAKCAVAPGDGTTWVQLLAAPPKRVLAAPFIQILVRRSLDQPLAYAPIPYGSPRLVASASDLGQAVLDELNAVRRQAKLGPVQRADAESAIAEQLAPHYFSSQMDGASIDKAEHLALGLIAGWQVGGMIRSGRFFSILAPHTRDAGRWLNAALERPLGRVTLLAPEIEQVAIGPLVLSAPDALGAVVAGYSFYRGEDHADDIRRLYQRLTVARKRLGLEMPARLGGMDAVLRDELGRVYRGEQQPADALQAALERAVGSFGANMRGYVMETTSLDALELPEEILKKPNLFFEIGVGHHKAPGAAWGQFVIVVLFADIGARSVQI